LINDFWFYSVLMLTIPPAVQWGPRSFPNETSTIHLTDLSVKFQEADGRTDRETRLFVRLSVRGVHPMWKQAAMLHRNLRGMVKIRNQPINTPNLVSSLSENSLKNATICHILRLRCTNSISGVCPFVRPSVRSCVSLLHVDGV